MPGNILGFRNTSSQSNCRATGDGRDVLQVVGLVLDGGNTKDAIGLAICFFRNLVRYLAQPDRPSSWPAIRFIGQHRAVRIAVR